MGIGVLGDSNQSVHPSIVESDDELGSLAFSSSSNNNAKMNNI